MLNNNLFVFKNDILFGILNEINFFKDYKINSEDNLASFHNNKDSLESHNSLFLLDYEKNLDMRDSFNKISIPILFLWSEQKPDLKFKHFEIKKPFKIVYLFNKIQKIFLSEKYNKRSFIKILDLSLDLNDRSITYNNLKLQLTEKEVEFILFLKKNNKPVTIESLLKNVWKYSKGIETHTIETHVHRLRKKILEKFNLNNIIKSKKNGYYI